MSIVSESTTTVLTVYSKLFRSPAALVIFFLIMVIYSAVILSVTSEQQLDLMQLVQAAPFAFSAIVVGFFSVLFWALNYISRERKHELRLREAEMLFMIRKNMIEDVLKSADRGNDWETKILKAHLLFAMGEIPEEPEVPGDGIPLDYGEALRTILRRS